MPDERIAFLRRVISISDVAGRVLIAAGGALLMLQLLARYDIKPVHPVPSAVLGAALFIVGIVSYRAVPALVTKRAAALESRPPA